MAEQTFGQRDPSAVPLDKFRTLEAERDALRLRVAALEAAILRWRTTHPWNTRSADIAARDAEDELWATTADVTTALRAMLVEACQEMRFSAIIQGDAYLKWDETGESIADRILGASKEGK